MANKKIKISIIIPIYNTEKYLKKCLDSLVNQTLQNIEIICINDGSTDNSGKILKKFAFKDKRIKIIEKENEGQSKARNIGIKKAKGEFLGFVDSDDWVDKNYFEKLYNAAIKHNCDIACCGFKRSGKIFEKLKIKYKNIQIAKDINAKVKIVEIPKYNYVCNKIYNTENFKKTNLNFENGRFFEDAAILIKILYYMGDLVTVPNTYYHYRKNNSSTVAAYSKKHINDYKWAMNELIEFSKKHNINISYNKKNIPHPNKKAYIKLFNINIIKIYYFEDKIKYNLFGFIPFITKVYRR